MKKHKYGRLCSVNMLFGVEKVMPLKWKIVVSEATIQKDWKGYFDNELERKMEQFFGKMKNEMFYGHENEFKSLDELYKAMVDYIDYYNNKRITVKLKGLTPCQARNQALSLT